MKVNDDNHKNNDYEVEVDVDNDTQQKRIIPKQI